MALICPFVVTSDAWAWRTIKVVSRKRKLPVPSNNLVILMAVAEIQRALIARGYDLGKSGADSDAGPRTNAAVTSFQRAAGLVADGIAGSKTQAAPQKPDISERREAPEKPG